MTICARGALAAAAPALLALALTGAVTGPAAAFKLGMAVGGDPSVDWMKAQGDVARALAKQRG